jgi:V/A-type H+-transporting ATPase subunit C
MSDASRFAYLHARVSLLAGQLLSARQLDDLIDQGISAEQQSSAPEDAASATAVAAQYTGDLDQNNVSILLKDLAVLIRPLSGPARDLLGYWAHRFEINNLKVIIRGRMAGQPQQAIEEQLLDMGHFTSLPVAELLQSDTTAELLRRLEKTPYAEIARQVRQLLEQGEAMFALDAALDRRYFAGLSRRSRAGSGSAGELLRSIVGSVIDRVNLVWLLRYRFAYQLPPSQTYYLLIPASHRLSPRHLQMLCQQASFEDAIANLPPPFAKLLEGCSNTTEATLRLEFETWRVAAHALNHSAFNVARALAYMVLRERDLRRLRAILRGHEMNMDASLIRTALGLAGSLAASAPAPA